MKLIGRPRSARNLEAEAETDDATVSGLGGWIRRGREALSEITSGSGLIAIVDQMVASATNLLTGIVIGRACSKEEFGLYMLGISIVYTVWGLQTALISTPYMVYGARLEGRDHRRYTGSTLLHQIAVSGITVTALVIASIFTAAHGIGQGLSRVLWTLAVVISFLLFREFARRICFANLEFRSALYVDVCLSVIQLTGLGLLAYSGLVSAVTAFWVIGFGAGVSSLLWLAFWRRVFLIDLRRAIIDLKHNWSVGKWVFLSMLLWMMSLNIYPWILAVFHGTASAGVWAACLGVIAIGNPVLLTAENYIGPRLSHAFVADGLAGLRKTVWRTSLAFTAMMTPFCLALVGIGGAIAVFFYGEKYAGNDMVISLLGLNLMVALIGIPLSRALFALERADLDFLVNFVPLVILLVVGLPLAQKLGPLGAGYGLLLGNVAGQAARAAVFARLSRSNATPGDP